MTKIDAKIIPNFCVGLVIEGTANWAVRLSQLSLCIMS